MPLSRRTAFAALQWLAAAGLGGTFIWAGVEKLDDPIRFMMDVRSYHLVDDPLPALVSVGLPWLEILCGAGLILGVLYHGSVIAVTGMLLVFLGAILSAWQRGLKISCGCFGESTEISDYSELLTRDVSMLAVALFLCAGLRHWQPWWRHFRKSNGRPAATASGPGASATSDSSGHDP